MKVTKIYLLLLASCLTGVSALQAQSFAPELREISADEIQALPHPAAAIGARAQITSVQPAPALQPFVGRYCGTLDIATPPPNDGSYSVPECWDVFPGEAPNILMMTYTDVKNVPQNTMYLNRIIYIGKNNEYYTVQALDRQKAWGRPELLHCMLDSRSQDCVQAVDDTNAWYQAGYGGCLFNANPPSCIEFYTAFDNYLSASEVVDITQNGFYAHGGVKLKSDGQIAYYSGTLIRQK